MTTTDTDDDRPMGPAIVRGLRCLCPACGQGAMLRGYLTLRPACPRCGETLSHARADDGPAYLTILIVGHLMAPAMLAVFTLWRPAPVVMMALFMPLFGALALALLPRLKGMIVAIQWSRRMHGFGDAEQMP